MAAPCAIFADHAPTTLPARQTRNVRQRMALGMRVCLVQPALLEVHRSVCTCLLEAMLMAATDLTQLDSSTRGHQVEG